MKKAKPPAKAAKPDDSPATSKTPCKEGKASRPFTAHFDPDFLDSVRCMTPEERKTIGQIITHVCDVFGIPHNHLGLGIRDLGNGFYECRKGLKTRLIFERVDPGNLHFHAIGSHDEVKRFLKRFRR